MYKRAAILFVSIFFLVFFGCIAVPQPEAMVGNDTDAHGCIGSAGYAWCEEKQKCLRTFEESCVNADMLNAQAEALFANFSFTEAYSLFNQSKAMYLTEGNRDAAKRAQQRMNTIFHISTEFNIINESKVMAAIDETVPNSTQAQRNIWLEHQYMTIDGQKTYFYSVMDNVLYYNPQVKRRILVETNKTGAMDSLFAFAFDKSFANYTGPAYINPGNYTGIETLYVNRTGLPAAGLLKIWVPLPVETDAQKYVSIDYIGPKEFLKSQTTNGDIGLAYFEIPLENLKEDLNITVRFRYAYYEQRFAIDPNRVGQYDRQGDLYMQYTKSDKNIVITPEMRETALGAVGNETNPYLQAQKIYWFILNTTLYNFMPHTTLGELNIPESEYVRKNGIGDCGSQSMYFAALARSIGIPARATGGYQLFNNGTGTHFWAEFYLQNYGWIPVDETAADMADWIYEPADPRNREIKEFYFANIDNLRFVIQKDVDVQLVPLNADPVFFPMVRQFPAAEIDSVDGDIAMAIVPAYKINITRAG